MTALTAGPPLEAPLQAVGRRTATVIDAARDGRAVTVDVWHPALPSDAPRTAYEPLPGITFEAAAAGQDAPIAPGPHPLLIVSHGRAGMRFVYSMLCEALAARGYVVASCDHPGDRLFDFLSGSFVDDAANESGRINDARLMIDVFTGVVDGPFGAELLATIDHDRIAVIGHSFGGFTALAAAAGARGLPADPRIRSIVCLQPFTRTLSDAELESLATPVLFVVSEFDATTPASLDADRPWALVTSEPAWRIDLAGGAHHASSDMGLYLQLVEQLDEVPAMVAGYLAMVSGEMSGPRYRPWRELLTTQLRAISAFFDLTLDIDPTRSEREISEVATRDGVTVQRR